MELLVQGLAAEHQSTPITRGSITFDPQVLVYGPGALSHHGEHLDARQRYENVRDNLSVAEGVNIRNKVVFVLDDVMTSGATLYCAQKYLRAAGARDVVLLALAQAISV
jgi:uracil phosphoribosyltransferase